jgi:hypothetical protein
MPGPYRISGALFHKQINNGPVLAGTIEIEGQKYNISLWPKTSKGGIDYLQISEDKRAEQKSGSGAGNAMAGGANRFRRPAPPDPRKAVGVQSPLKDYMDPDDDPDNIPF